MKLLLLLLTLPEVTHWNDMQDNPRHRAPDHGMDWTRRHEREGIAPHSPATQGIDHWPAPSQTTGLAQRQPRCLQTPLPIFCETLR
jgi:hypothetical protein